jgi:D-alanyl-D-alanine dipeptidase
VSAHRRLASHGYGLLVFDGYRPWAVTKNGKGLSDYRPTFGRAPCGWRRC